MGLDEWAARSTCGCEVQHPARASCRAQPEPNRTKTYARARGPGLIHKMRNLRFAQEKSCTAKPVPRLYRAAVQTKHSVAAQRTGWAHKALIRGFLLHRVGVADVRGLISRKPYCAGSHAFAIILFCFLACSG